MFIAACEMMSPLMTKRDHADWSAVTSRLFSSASQPSSKLLQATYEPTIATALCNLSPFNPYWPPNVAELFPSPGSLQEPPSVPFQSPSTINPTTLKLDLVPLDSSRMAIQGHHGVGTWSQKPDYKAYKSPYGPNYNIRPNFHGIGPGRALKFGITAGSFGVVAGVFALFFFADVPKVRRDIMQKLPVVGDYFVREVPPSDNPF
ncbi:hypothetical protein XPA_006442 [Xanthoria parietina]